MIRPKDVTRTRGASLASQFIKATEDLVFHHVHGRQLIYNTCWEDPRIDRQLLKLDGGSRVVVITSAGRAIPDVHRPRAISRHPALPSVCGPGNGEGLIPHG